MSKQNDSKLQKTNAELSALTKRMGQEQMRSIILRSFKVDCDPDDIIKKIVQDLLPKFENIDPKQKKYASVEKELRDALTKGMIVLGLENHYPMAETVSEKYRPLVVELARELTIEYKCKTPTEKALVDIAVGAYGRILDYSSKLNNCTRVEFLSSEKNGYFSMLGKELDRAERHFQAALMNLKAIKSPNFEVNVKTAFMAQNQQFNAVQKETGKPTQQEINDPK
jgi:hypothetical protein